MRVLLCLLLLFPPMCARSQSFVYAPSITLPARPMETGETEVRGGGAMLAETRPRWAKGIATAGGEISIRHALGNRLTLGIKGWADPDGLSAGEPLRSGICADALVTLPASDSNRQMALMPRAAIILDGNRLQGWGTEVALAIWLPHFGPLAPYCGLGLMAGFRTVTREGSGPLAAFNISPGPYPSWGYGVGCNLGGSVELGAGAGLYLELAAAVQTNLYSGETRLAILPAAGIAWRF
ncbi:MAG: hypothetical protein JWQ98_1935 [Chlorobi bacterium]|nr:hypothetical protein [Chlorobiota bacterium]